MRIANRTVLALLSAVVSLAAIASEAGALTPGQICEKRAATELKVCGRVVSSAHLRCLRQTNAACPASDAKIAAALARVESRALDACPDGAALVGAGYSAALTPAGLVSRLQEACTSNAMSLVARSFGGPHAAVRSAAIASDRACLEYAYLQGRKMILYAYRQQSSCLLAAHAGRSCDSIALAAKIDARQQRIVDAVSRRCPLLSDLVAVDANAFVRRAADQSRCLTATAHAQTAPLDLDCGPRPEVPVPSQATPTQVILDSSTWGTRCGDGSDYAFWINLAPPGQPVGKVVVFMQGGGRCDDGPSCAATPANLFTAQNENMAQTGLMSSSAATNPFRDWTKVFIPYCTQDQHTGSGVLNAFPEMTVYRYGALNLRAALRYVRDVLWASMDATDAEGFRPDRLTVLLSGSSAGGGGAQFNYHYLLDDLGWAHTTLLADSALGLDNGLGSAHTAAALALLPTTPGWGAEPMAPPYCHTAECGELWNHLMFAQAPRLKAVPEQQILSLTNQVDNVQRNVAEFGSTPAFVNALRTKYCQQKGTTGLHSFLSASTQWEHGNITVNTLYNTVTADGVLMRDWIGAAMASPDTLDDAVSEGTLEQDFAGVLPFPCTLD